MSRALRAPRTTPPGSIRSGAWFAALVLATAWPLAAAEGLFESHDVLEMTLRAPLERLLAGAKEGLEVDAEVELQGAAAFPMRVGTYGKSRFRECDLFPLRLTASSDGDGGSPFGDTDVARLVTHCRSLPRYESSLLREYMVYRLYEVLAEPALRVRLARVTYRDTENPGREDVAYAFFVEDISDAAARHDLAWLEVTGLRLADLDPTHTERLILFNYMVGNHDWSVLAGPPGERCCHNVAVLGTSEQGPFRLLPFDFDQSGLVDAPYAAPARNLGLRLVTQRRYRGFCAHNREIEGAVAYFNGRRSAIEGLFRGEDLPYPKALRPSQAYIEAFFREINDPQKLERRLVRHCRQGLAKN